MDEEIPIELPEKYVITVPGGGRQAERVHLRVGAGQSVFFPEAIERPQDAAV